MDDTRQRLLDAAGTVFAEKGFEAATVRDICQRAGVNIAAVSFHFRGKQALYRAVLEHAHHCNTDPVEAVVPPGLPPADQLRHFVRHMMLKMVADDPGWHNTLMLREMSDPTDAGRLLVGEFIGPMFAQLVGVLRRLLPAHLSDRAIHLHGFSVVAQCLLYRYHRPVGQILVGDHEYTTYTADLLAEHVFRFSLGGIAAAHAVPPPAGDLTTIQTAVSRRAAPATEVA